MKLLTQIIMLCSLAIINTPDASAQEASKEKKQDANLAEEMPEYPGGIDAMNQFIVKNMRYPDSAINANIEGKIKVKFIVDENGIVGDVHAVNSLGYGLEQEAERVVAIMPHWKPGKANGKLVKVYFVLPIQFVIDAEDKQKTHKKRKHKHEKSLI
jgi:protein TonB